MKQSGIVFDFNGTLFRDSDINELTWGQFLSERFEINPSREELVQYMHGFNNRDTLEHFLKRKLTEEEVEDYTENGKEALYRNYIIEHPERQRLVDGVPELLDLLTKSGVPITIATASAKNNLDFFIDLFELERWFDPKKIVYNDGTLPGKPEPDIYLKSFKNLALNPEECIVCEDAPSGVLAARRAGAGRIIGVDAEGQSKLEEVSTDQIIKDFHSFDRNWINFNQFA